MFNLKGFLKLLIKLTFNNKKIVREPSKFDLAARSPQPNPSTPTRFP